LWLCNLLLRNGLPVLARIGHAFFQRHHKQLTGFMNATGTLGMRTKVALECQVHSSAATLYKLHFGMSGIRGQATNAHARHTNAAMLEKGDEW